MTNDRTIVSEQRRARTSMRNLQVWAAFVIILMVGGLFYMTYLEQQALERVEMAAAEARDAAQQTERILVEVREGATASEDVQAALADIQLVRAIIVESICDNEDAPAACAAVE